MNFKLNASLLAIASMMSAGAAHAANADTTGAIPGSAIFVALGGGTGTAGQKVSLAVDLGTLIDPFVNTPGVANNAGAWTTPGTTVSWDFATNTELVNGVAVNNGQVWSSAVGQFFANSTTTSTFKWGVIGASGNGDNSANGGYAGTSVLETGTSNNFSTTLLNTTNLGSASGRIATYITNNNGTGTFTTAQTGVTTTPGSAYTAYSSSAPNNALSYSIVQNGVGTFGLAAGQNFLVTATTGAASSASIYYYINDSGVESAYQLGSTNSAGAALTTGASQFTFNSATETLTYDVPAIPAVPEPGSYAMMFAGLAAVGFIARRRSQQG